MRIHEIPGLITRIEQILDNGQRLLSLSRRHRKGLPALPVNTGATSQLPAMTSAMTSAWRKLWAVKRLAWWIALLFIIGSACFAWAAFASNWPHFLPVFMSGNAFIAKVFFIGSVFFSSAAALQLLEAINGDVADIGQPQVWRWFAWKPHNAGYLSSLIQFAGTLLFNINTFDAMQTGLNWLQQDVWIWTPDMIGSICFLLAGYLALIEISHGWWSFQPRQVAWWVVMINLAGSLAFQISAFYALLLPGPEAGWVWNANLWTLVGALCFFAASYLMLPELFDADAAVLQSA